MISPNKKIVLQAKNPQSKVVWMDFIKQAAGDLYQYARSCGHTDALDLKQITPLFLNQRQFQLSCKFTGFSTDSISSTEKEGGSNDTSSHSKQEKNKSDSKDFDSPQVPDRRLDTEKQKTTTTTATTTTTHNHNRTTTTPHTITITIIHHAPGGGPGDRCCRA